MSDQDKATDNLPKAELSRRSIFTLAAAVAAFGAAMGVRASPASAAETVHLYLKANANEKKNHKDGIKKTNKKEPSIWIKDSKKQKNNK